MTRGAWLAWLGAWLASACLEVPERPLPIDPDAASEVSEPLAGCLAGQVRVPEGETDPAGGCRTCGPSGGFVACPFGCGAGGSCRLPVEAALGASHSCARLDDGSVVCWGARELGQLGGGIDTLELGPTHLPEPVSGLPPVAALQSGRDHTCARTATGDLYCWGFNRYGQVDPAAGDAVVPEPRLVMQGVSGFDSKDHTTCALKEGSVWCWGIALDGQTWSETDVAVYSEPSVVEAVTFATDLAVGSRSACALVEGGVVCWGSGENGELGDGRREDSARAHAVAFAAPVAGLDLDSGLDFWLLTADGGARLYGWGQNERYQLASVAGVDGAATPVDLAVLAPTPIRVARGGASHACALAGDGAVWCWGRQDSGNLGHREAGDHPPRAVFGLGTPIDLWIGLNHGCALDEAHWLRCWGDNHLAQAGAPLTYGPVVTRPVIVSMEP